MCSDPRRSSERAQPSFGRHGIDHRNRYLGSWSFRPAAEYQSRTADDVETQRILDGSVRQVSRGSAVANIPGGTVHVVADGRRRIRAFLRIHRRGEQPVLPGAVRGRRACRAGQDTGGGLPPHRRPCRSRHRLGSDAEVLGSGQAVLRLLCTRRHTCTAPCSEGVGRQVRGPVRRRLGRPTRIDSRAAEAAGSRSRGCGPHPASRGHSGVGGHE